MAPNDRGDDIELGAWMGRLDEKLTTIKEKGEDRDRVMARINDLQHQTANTLQIVSNQVEGLQKKATETTEKLTETSVQLSGLDARVKALEAPVKKGEAARQARRRSLKSIVAIVVTITGFLWAFIDPAFKLILEILIRNHMAGSPH